MIKFKVICINDKSKPDGIPLSKWIKESEVYTVTHVTKLLIQGGKLGYKLAEVNIDDCFPYQYFDATRFALLSSPGAQWAEKELDRILEDAKQENSEINLFKLGST
jgi:hypothetical protein